MGGVGVGTSGLPQPVDAGAHDGRRRLQQRLRAGEMDDEARAELDRFVADFAAELGAAVERDVHALGGARADQQTMVLLDHVNQRDVHVIAANAQCARENQMIVNHCRDGCCTRSDVYDQGCALVVGINSGTENCDDSFIDEVDIANTCLFACVVKSAMFDRDTMIVTYDKERGEPRGGRKKTADTKALNLGSCVDCSLCVQVCPTGIDIRDGLQYECIGCSACIDVCDTVMDKMSYPRGLIRYSTENAVEKHWDAAAIRQHMLRPRILIYFAVLVLLVAGLLMSLALRNPLKVDVIRDRQVLAREVEGRYIENVYKLNVMNTAEQTQKFVVTADGLPDISIARGAQILADPASTAAAVLAVRVPIETVKPGSHPIRFKIQSETDASIHVDEKSVFLIPR